MDQPSLPWRAGYGATLGFVGSMTKAFMYGLNYFHVQGLDHLVHVLESREKVNARQRGLITVSNHVSVYVYRNRQDWL